MISRLVRAGVGAGLALTIAACGVESNQTQPTEQSTQEALDAARARDDFFTIVGLGRATVVAADGDAHEVDCGGELSTLGDEYGMQVIGGAIGSGIPIEIDMAPDSVPILVTNEAHGSLVAVSNNCGGGVMVELKSVSVLSGGQGLQTWEVTNENGAPQTILIANQQATQDMLSPASEDGSS